MIEELLQQDRELARARINSETARIPWQDLQRFFAAGKVIKVGVELDLVNVAYAMQCDDVAQLQRWTEAGGVAPASDAEAREWVAGEAVLWAVVVKPWVLVQDRD